MRAERDQLRLHQRARLGRRQRADLLRRLDARSRPGDLRSEDQASARRRQRPADEADGKVTYGEIMDLSDDFRDGFVDSLRLDAPEQTRFAATRAERSSGNFTVFQNGVYTACEPCKDDPTKAAEMAGQGRPDHPRPGREDDVFRGRAARILRRAARLYAVLLGARSDREAQDRLSGADVSHELGLRLGVAVPYYWALAPDYDFTFTPMITTKQGPLLQGEWRQRLMNGSYTHPRIRHFPARQGRVSGTGYRPPAIATGAAASRRRASSS